MSSCAADLASRPALLLHGPALLCTTSSLLCDSCVCAASGSALLSLQHARARSDWAALMISYLSIAPAALAAPSPPRSTKWSSAKADGTCKIARLATALAEYQSPEKVDKILAVDKSLVETKAILHKTIEAVLERGEKLDDLVDKSAALSATSRAFYKTVSTRDFFRNATSATHIGGALLTSKASCTPFLIPDFIPDFHFIQAKKTNSSCCIIM